ncbi:CHAT domain-containing protein [Nostoc sp. GT001]|uniref:CHAT domain-containing protein n=1 Tax=Nostoc sp. GT001 TaxID=3056647 RepID=UPI0025AA39DE|nr:CHAT domain-containing protein [Nostoc sp. GT001]MDM9580334.1 CHAT domain-containing protein [Nostoc sp. GT001]
MMIRFRYCFKYLLLVILGLSIVVSQPFLIPVQAVNKEAQQQKEADLLTQRGQKQLDIGQAQEAFESWQKATKIYQKLQYEDGITGSLINQNLALQALGLHYRACNTLLSALKLDVNASLCATTPQQPTESMEKLLTAAINKQTPSPVNLLGLHNLGEVLRRLGKLDESKKVLEEILSDAKWIPSVDTSGILLSLGSTRQDIYKQIQNKHSEMEDPFFQKEFVNFIHQQALESLDIYQQVVNTSNAPKEVQLQAKLRRLNLLLDFDNWLAVESNSGNTRLSEVRTRITQQIQPAVALLLKSHSTFSQLPASYSIYAKLNFAKSLNQIPDQQFHSLAIEYAESALQTAKSTNSQRLQSESLGTLGKLKLEQSQPYFEEALGLAQSVQAWDLAYQWQQELGKLYKEQRKYKEAAQAYSAAIENVTHVRDNLLATNADLQFSFKEKVEPLYRDYMRLLLVDSNPNLEQVIQTNERLQIAELENYLQCGKLNLVALNDLKNLAIMPSVIHIIDLGNSIEVVVQSPDKSLHHHSVDPKLVKVHANHLLQTLHDQKFANTRNFVIIDYSQALYNSLIAPIKKYLPPDGTLVFTLDTSFQNLPMGLLHDGKDYFLKHYNIAETLGSKVRQPKLLPKKQLRALIGGLSKSSPSFQAVNAPKDLTELPSVLEEIANVKEQTNSSLSLINEEFTYKRFIKEVTTENFPIIHLTTHAQFNSVPQLTMFFSWDKPINLLEFDSLLKQKNQINEDAIELLVLSGCETAKGNKRSALGIAGIAAQAGARSTVATLWRVDDKSTALLMKEFYKELKDGKTKTEALRLAQLSLLSNPKYSHPYYWAGFLLIGGWL